MKKTVFVLALAAMSAMVACKQQEKKVVLASELDSVSYALGINISESMQKQGADSINAYILQKGYEAFACKDSALLMTAEESLKFLQQYFRKKAQEKFDKNLKEGQDFLNANKTKEGVVTLADGLQYQILKEGTGPVPTAADRVKVHYKGTLINGEVFDSSEGREPVTFPVSGVIKGWTEALQLMPVGSKWKLFIPSELAYGMNPRPGGMIEPNAALIFEVELLEIVTDEEEKK